MMPLFSQTSLPIESDPNCKIMEAFNPGDIVFSLDIEAITGDNQLLGCEFDGVSLWVTGAGNGSDPNYLYQIDPFAGTLQNSYGQPPLASGWGIRDLAIANGLIYGGNESHFFAFDPQTETWEVLFESTFGTIRGLAWDGFHFWTKSFAGALYEFDVSGNVINTYSPTVASSTCGIAFDDVKELLYLFNQNDAAFYGFDLSGNYTGETIDVSSAQAGGLAGGAFFDRNNLVPGTSVLGFNMLGAPDICAAIELEVPVQYTNDVGVSYIISPEKLVSTIEPIAVIFRLKNYGLNPQANIPWRLIAYYYNHTDTISGIYAQTLLAGEYAEIVADSVTLFYLDNVDIEVCTTLDGDEQAANNCKARDITFVPQDYNLGYTVTEDEYIANVLFGEIDNSSLWQGGVADYTDLSTSICIGDSAYIIITNGNPWPNDKVTCWADWNQDYYFDYWVYPNNEEYVLNKLYGQGEYFDGWISVPPGTPVGTHQLRIRMTYSSDPIPYGESSYGEIEDYTINVIDPSSNDVGVVSIDMAAFSYPTTIIPKATIINKGTEVQAFTVTISIGDYTSTKSVDMLAYREARQISFDEWFANPGSYTIQACTDLTGDENPSNDCKTMEINIAGANFAYGFNYGGDQDSIVRFDISSPGNLFNFAPIQSLNAISAACFVNGAMRAVAMDGLLYAINPETCEMTFIDTTSANSGLAYDGNRFYGCSYTQLFEIDPETGQEVLIGDMGDSTYMNGISCDMYGALYGFDIGDGNFYSINKTNGEATLIGNLGYDFTGLQDMSFDKETNTCYISGYVSSQLKGLFQVDVFTGTATLLYNYPANIRIIGLAIPYSTFPPAGPAPEGFMASYEEGMGVQCAWGYPPPETWIGYDDGTNNDGLGLDGGGTYWGAFRFEPEDLMEYDNLMITQVAFFPRKFANAADMTLMIWEGADAANLIYEQEMTNLNWNEWNEVVLNLSYYIDATTELWIGFKVEHIAGEYPLGYDDGPAVAGYGDMISLDGINWMTMSGNGMDFNFNLRGLVVYGDDIEAGSKSVLKKTTVENPSGKLIAGHLKPIENSDFNPESKYFLGTNVYRDNVQVNTELISGYDYQDDFHTPGTYIYTAKNVYEDGFSDPSDPAVVLISGATIAVHPDSIVETHNNPPQLTTRTLTITNNGNIPLDWEMVDFEGSGKLSYANDVGVSTINAPTSSIIYTDSEPVIFTIKNFGDVSQSNIPWELSWEGPSVGDIISGVYIGNLASGETVEITADTIDMTSIGDYLFEACTQFPGDENPDNNCKTKLIFGPMTYCGAFTDNEDEYIANVKCGFIDNSSGWQGGVADYTDISAFIPPGASEEISVTNGNAWAADNVTVWVDWNNDFIFDTGTNEEFILEDISGTGDLFTSQIVVPAETLNGSYRMRIRMTKNSAPEPCGTSLYGEVEDYTIIVGELPTSWWYTDFYSGQVSPGESVEVDIAFNSLGLDPGTYTDILSIHSNDVLNPIIEVPLVLHVSPTILNPPRNLTAEIINGNNVLLTWQPPIGSKTQGNDIDKTKALLGYNMYRNDEIIATNVSDTSFLDGLPAWGSNAYFVTALYDQGESGPSNTVIVSGPPQPPSPPQNLQYEIVEDSIRLFWEQPASGLFDFYNVYRDGSIMGSAEEPEYLDPFPPQFPVVYWVTAFSEQNGESDTSNNVIVVAQGFVEYDAMIQLFPNPAKESLMILSDQQISSIMIFNVHGEIVFHQKLAAKKQHINTSEFKAGIYTVRLKTEQGITSRKLIIK